ncbi:MAG: hypothetical protein RBR52_15130 [Thiomonas sp.]|uniref:hypothetical protein n=1 Tax=Thiomonas sp. TaxID=2047785 RepID=UPI002A36C085|nr:hypothetical protein [Thiomonas sp.]MDY0331810.1 hypothetical protein [Thiomonas sp.]
MTDNTENLILEHLKRFQAGQDRIERKLDELPNRIAHLEVSISRVARDESSNYAEIIQDRHTVDRLKERLERIERRLELS